MASCHFFICGASTAADFGSIHRIDEVEIIERSVWRNINRALCLSIHSVDFILELSRLSDPPARQLPVL
jgi:hypothetical protein